MADFDFQSYFRPSPSSERPLLPLLDEYRYDVLESVGLYFDVLAQAGVNRRYINDILTRACAMIDVDPAEAIAQNFVRYVPMVEWLRTRYHTRVIELCEAQLERHYQAICEAYYAKYASPNHDDSLQLAPPQEGANRVVPVSHRPHIVIGHMIQKIFRAIIDRTIWWEAPVKWILNLSRDPNLLLQPPIFVKEIEDDFKSIFEDQLTEDEMNRILLGAGILLDAGIPSETQA